MALVSPVEVVRGVFESVAARDFRRLYSLMAPDIAATTVADGDLLVGADAAVARLVLLSTGEGRRAEVFAYRFVADGEDVIVHGRIRIFEGGALRDSPAAWHFTVRDGLVVRMEPATAGAPVAAPA
jgi:hypothetical protein